MRLFEATFNAKLLLTGEYAVLDGAKALALPITKFGQHLQIDTQPDLNAGMLSWHSLDEAGRRWLVVLFDTTADFHIIASSTEKLALATKLQLVLQTARKLNPSFLLNSEVGLTATMQLNYPIEWGLGSSSTLLAAVADWAAVDAFALNTLVFGGSGYDIACATRANPFLFSLQAGKPIPSEPTAKLPSFAAYSYFIYLGKKQDSREGIAHYRQLSTEKRQAIIPELSAISTQLFAEIDTIPYSEFNTLLNKHETILAQALNLETVKKRHFSDFWGSVKSLGAWGGDFVLATSDRSEAETRHYFLEKGFKVFFAWQHFF